VYCWGDNGQGQLGDGTTTDRWTPVPVSGISNAVELASGHYHTCARLATGDIACWGDNFNGQLGDGSTTDRSTPVMVLGFPSITPTPSATSTATDTPTPTSTSTATSTSTPTPTATPTSTSTSTPTATATSTPTPTATATATVDPSSWWNCDYDYRQQITITAGSVDVPANYTVWFDFDHQSLVSAGKSLNSGLDVRIVYWNGSGWTELDRLRDDLRPWNQPNTRVWFQTQAAISASGSDNDYYMYYGNSSPGSPPMDWSNVYLFYDNFNDGSFDTGLWTCTMGTCTEASGRLYLNSNERVLANAGYSIGTDTLWEARIRLQGSGLNAYFNYWNAGTSSYYGGDFIAMWADGSQHIAENQASGMSTSFNFDPSSPTIAHIYKFNRDGTGSVHYYQDSNEITELFDDIPTGDLRAFIWNDNTGFDEEVDFVRIRDYVDPEPTSGLGSEEPSTAYCP
jgi:hypothetical protein